MVHPLTLSAVYRPAGPDPTTQKYLSSAPALVLYHLESTVRGKGRSWRLIRDPRAMLGRPQAAMHRARIWPQARSAAFPAPITPFGCAESSKTSKCINVDKQITFSLIHAGLSSKPTAPWHRAWCRKDEPRTRFSFSLPVAEERSGPVESARAPFHRPPVALLHPLDFRTISLHRCVH